MWCQIQREHEARHMQDKWITTVSTRIIDIVNVMVWKCGQTLGLGQ